MTRPISGPLAQATSPETFVNTPPLRPTKTSGVAPSDEPLSERALLPDSPSGRPPQLEAGVLDSPLASARGRTAFDALERGGLEPAIALRILHRGLTAAEAAAVLSPATLEPSTEDYGPALTVLHVLRAAAARGRLSGEDVRDLIDVHRSLVVVRPDGYLAHALTGRPIERAPQLAFKDPQIGYAYHLRDGVLRSIDAELRPQEPPIAELGLGTGPILDGVEQAGAEMLLGIAGLVEGLATDPAGTVERMFHAAGQIPRTVAEVLRSSPEIWARFGEMTPDDRVRAVSKLGTTIALSLEACGAVLRAPHAVAGAIDLTLGGGSGGAALATSVQGGGLRLAFGPGLVVDLAIDGGAALGALGGGATGAGVLGGFGWLEPRGETTSYAEGDVDGNTARARWKAEQRVLRAFGDPRNPAFPLEDLPAALEESRRMGALEANACLRWAQERLGAEVRAIDALQHPRHQLRQAQALRAVADRAGISLHQALHLERAPAPAARLSREAEQAMRAIRGGQDEINVSSRAVAEEVLGQHPALVETPHWPPTRTRALFARDFENTFHWDVEVGPDGRLLHHPGPGPHGATPHLQLELSDGRTVRIFLRHTR